MRNLLVPYFSYFTVHLPKFLPFYFIYCCDYFGNNFLEIISVSQYYVIGNVDDNKLVNEFGNFFDLPNNSTNSIVST